MKTRYYTQKGSVYIQTLCGRDEYWLKEDHDGCLHALIGGIHIARRKLKELIREYPSTLLDKTYCFDIGVEQEFFEDAKRECFRGKLGTEPTVIFFLVRRDNRYAIGSSSEVVKIEKEQDSS